MQPRATMRSSPPFALVIAAAVDDTAFLSASARGSSPSERRSQLSSALSRMTLPASAYWLANACASERAFEYSTSSKMNGRDERCGSLACFGLWRRPDIHMSRSAIVQRSLRSSLSMPRSASMSDSGTRYEPTSAEYEPNSILLASRIWSSVLATGLRPSSRNSRVTPSA